jgi:uroporphyrinogen decarboxylase
LIPLEPLGINLSFEEGGPKLSPPLREPSQVDGLSSFDPDEKLSFVLKGIEQIRVALDSQVPLIGFCGSPFTLLCYLVEGGGSKNFAELKQFIYRYPEAAARALNLLADLVGRYLKAQINAGAQAVQLFDTWGGILSITDYEKFSLPYNRRLFDLCHTAQVPRILYLGNTSSYLPLLADLNCEVISVDWRTDLLRAKKTLTRKAIQGNLDPTVLLGTKETVISEARSILRTMADSDGFVFNLGHGILPETPVENVHALVDTVHNFLR